MEENTKLKSDIKALKALCIVNVSLLAAIILVVAVGVTFVSVKANKILSFVSQINISEDEIENINDAIEVIGDLDLEELEVIINQANGMIENLEEIDFVELNEALEMVTETTSNVKETIDTLTTIKNGLSTFFKK